MDAMRLDKWLWQARFFKSRAAATRLCAAGRVRIDGRPVAKAHQPVKPGDVLTFPQGRAIRVVRVVGLDVRRGPAAEARTLYEDLSPLPGPFEASAFAGAAGAGARGEAARALGEAE
jgi:ribosome-associated heat shock protein Hsp15